MKKKILSGILCLLMVFTMVPGIFAEEAETASHGHPIVLPGNTMIDECPKCDYSAAFIYIKDGKANFSCPSCKESGSLFEENTFIPGVNVSPCTNVVKCDCGRSVLCGSWCNVCEKYNNCGHRYYPSFIKCVCGSDCDCIVLCDCGRFVYCGTKCPNCYRNNYCDPTCTSCEFPACKCGCGLWCDATVKCDGCGHYATCGTYCSNCRKYAYCDEYCTECVDPDFSYTPDYPYNCVCGYDCDCLVKCYFCGGIGFCGSICGTCDRALNCGIFCKDCFNWGWYPTYSCICGYDCNCIVECSFCKTVNFCGEKCSTCGKYQSCGYNCNTCTNPNPVANRVYITQSYGGTYEITNGLYGTKGETKTLTVKPMAGFTVSSVTINGVSYGDKTEFQLPMDRSYYITITYAKLGFIRQYNIQSTVTGFGTVHVTRNNVTLKDTASVTAAHKDTLYYTFIPAENHYIKDVKVNGVSLGAVSLYSITELTQDTTIDVVFGWNNPYTDIAPEHLAAVEYATTKKLMSHFYTYRLKNLFKGEKNLTVMSLVTTLAEAADVKNVLNTETERYNWAVTNGLIAEEANTSAKVNAAAACEIIAKYLDVVAKANKVTFTDDKTEFSAKETCLTLKLISEKAYDENKNLTRYDFAEILLNLSKVAYTKAQ